MWKKATFAAAAFALASGTGWAQPEIVSLGSGGPNSVTPSIGGTYYVGGTGFGGASRWTLTGNVLTAGPIGGTGSGLVSADGAFAALTELNAPPQINGNTATNVSPPFSMTPKLVPVPLAATEGRSARWDASTSLIQTMGGLPIVPELMVYGSGSSGGSTGNFLSPHAISGNGRFIVGLGYISSYSNSSGTTISSSTFQWRPWIWDAEANDGAGAYTVLPTPFRTSSNTWRRRTGNAYDVSDDGLVILGAQEHNSAGQPGVDPDGGRPVVWRFNADISQYEMTFLPNGVNESGQFHTYSTTVGSMAMNGEGTIIVGPAVDNAGTTIYIAKWIWDAGTSTWSAPINLGSNLTTPASWLPGSVTSCPIPPRLQITGMTEDGNTVVGIATYSTCGSFMAGGFIWTSASGEITDWYDYLSEAAGPTIFNNYGPIGDNGDPNRGLPRLGFPTSIARDGSAIVGLQGGNQLIPGAAPWIVVTNGGVGCVAPVVTVNPAATIDYSACTSSIILNVGAAGTLPISYQWYKDGEVLLDGMTLGGSTVTGATTFQARVNQLLSPSDAGIYHAVLTGACGKPVSSATSNVRVDPLFPAPANDICTGAEAVVAGVNVLSPAQGVCGAMVNDVLGASCFGPTKGDRWFVFTPVADGNYRIETCGSNYDTVLSVFPGCEGGELACNDNYTSGTSTGCASARSRASVQMLASTPYYIRIAAPLAAFISSSSTMNLSIIPTPAPAANDTCDAAAVAVVGVNNFDTTEATNDLIVSCNTAVTPRDVWFSFTAPAQGTLRLATCPGTTWNTVLSVYSECFGAEVACNDDAGLTGCSSQSVIGDLTMTAAQTYLIRVGTNNNTAHGGAGVLNVEFEIDCRADFNDDGFANSQDFFDFLTAFFNGEISSDFNGDTLINSQDFFDFLTVFFAGC